MANTDTGTCIQNMVLLTYVAYFRLKSCQVSVENTDTCTYIQSLPFFPIIISANMSMTELHRSKQVSVKMMNMKIEQKK